MGLRTSRSSALPGAGGRWEDEPGRKDACPSRVRVAGEPQPRLERSIQAQVSRLSPGTAQMTFKKENARQSQAFWGLGPGRGECGSQAQTLLGLNPSPAS